MIISRILLNNVKMYQKCVSSGSSSSSCVLLSLVSFIILHFIKFTLFTSNLLSSVVFSSLQLTIFESSQVNLSILFDQIQFSNSHSSIFDFKTFVFEKSHSINLHLIKLLF